MIKKIYVVEMDTTDQVFIICLLITAVFAMRAVAALLTHDYTTVIVCVGMELFSGWLVPFGLTEDICP